MSQVLPELIAWLGEHYRNHPNVQKVECQLTSSIEYRVKLDRQLFLIGHYEIVETGQMILLARKQFALGKIRIINDPELIEIQEFLQGTAAAN